MRRHMLTFLLACSLYAHSQSPTQNLFSPPFDFPSSFSGNFGEIRSAHFHGGLDFKTGGTIRQPVRALADGYISRIKVSNGSGCMLYVTYQNGYTTINRHLEAYMPAIAKRVRTLQQKEESYEIDITPAPGEYPVKRGEQIAWSGNRGYSMGPHLHLDVQETATGDFVDPIPLFPSIVDHKAPKAESLMVVARDGEGTLKGGQHKTVMAAAAGGIVEAWGVIGCALKAYDYMDGAANRCGVRSVVLTVDGDTISSSTVDRFSQEESKMVDSWTTGGYMKSFIDPNNPLRMLRAYNGNRGWVNIDKEKDYRFTYILTDARGNSSRCSFTVRGRKMQIAKPAVKEKHHMAWDKNNMLHEPGMTLDIPAGTLYDDVNLNFAIKGDSNGIALKYKLTDKVIIMREYATISIGLRRMPTPDTSKYYVALVSGESLNGVGGKYENGFITARIHKLGTYTVGVDTVPPLVTPINMNTWRANGKIAYSIRDAATGIGSCRATIDGKFALLYRPNITKTHYFIDLDPEYIKKGGAHRLEIEVTDGCGNKTVVKETFAW